MCAKINTFSVRSVGRILAFHELHAARRPCVEHPWIKKMPDFSLMVIRPYD